MKKSILIGALAAATSLAAAAPSFAESILYRIDYLSGTDYLGQAVTATGATVTTTDGSLSGYDLSNYNIVVYANQGGYVPGGDIAALDAYVAGGGKVIFDDWTGSDSFTGDQTFDGDNNQTTITLSAYNSGISGPLSVVNPGWTTFSTGLTTLPGGVSSATFEDGDSAIVTGNNGRTIVNGFLSDTVASEQLYTNELGALSAVPEPAAWSMMLVGFGVVGAGLRRRKAMAVA